MQRDGGYSSAIPHVISARGNRSDTDEACDKKRIWQQDKENRWKKPKHWLQKTQTPHTLLKCVKETRCKFYLRGSLDGLSF